VKTLGQLSSAVAHELTQPLTAILSNAQAAQRMLTHPSVDLVELRNTIGDIIEDDSRAGEVIAQLRTLYRKSEARLEPLYLPDLVEESLRLAIADLVGRHIDVKTEFQSGLPPIMGDRVQLQQVVLNLIVNAAQVLSDTQTPAPRITITVRRGFRSPGFVKLRVSDNGPGLSPQVMSHLFEPFFSTRPHGLGLGLSICRTIVNAHGGRLAALNNADAGACFVVRLPVAQEIAA
jgi:two-component system sensor kinase FixL